ncbi:MAG: DUF2089 domain-containing protein [Anaerolineales bacterium]|nr:DUF2089 domain-containing protein [Anaerolineales bacterium]
MNKIPQQCPSCAAPLMVSQLTCVSCGTGVVGNFELSPFMRLSSDSLRFLESFVRNRGNVKEMARASGESYWTIRRQLDEIIAEMGFEGEQPSQADLAKRRQEILHRLSQGEIDVSEAKQLLAAMEDE